MSGAFRIDLLDPTTRMKVGDFPISTATQVTRSEGLDRIGKWQFDLPVTDPALADIEGKDFAVYWLYRGETYFLGECSYLDHGVDAGRAVQVTASGRLRDLQRQTVLQRGFDGATDDVNDVLSTIVPLRAGWGLGAVDTVAKAAPMDFWYETIFDGVALLASTFGQHFREGGSPRTLDFGAFGQESGLLAVGGEELQLPPEFYGNPEVCPVDTLSVAYQSSQIVNRLIPFGGAVGVATIDLRETTVTQAGYPVRNANLPGGGKYYYIDDPTSVAQYGLTERRFLRKDLRPISNSPAARRYAANVLYEAALASLLNLKDRQTIYDLSLAGWAPGRVRVGDKIRVLYRGVVETRSGSQAWLDIDEGGGQGKPFYILEISETFGDGVSAQLKINENAVHEETVEDLLANTIRQFEQAQIHVQPTISRYTVGPYTKRVSASPSVGASYSFKLGPETLNVWYVKIALTGEPLKASVTGAQSGGGATSGSSSQSSSGPSSLSSSGSSSSTSSGSSSSTSSGSSSSSSSGSSSSSTTADENIHGHQWRINHDGSPAGSQLYVKNGEVVANYGVDVNINTGSGNAHDHGMNHDHNIEHNHYIDHTHYIDHVHYIDHLHNIQHTHTVPAHTHPLTYGIFQDTVRPSLLTIRINGVIEASGIVLNAGNNYTYELDITSRILAAANLQQEHTITVTCSSGRGELQFQAQVLAVIQGITVT